MIISDSCETPIHENNRESINDLLADGHQVDDDIFQLPRTNPSLQGILTNQYINRYRNGV